MQQRFLEIRTTPRIEPDVLAGQYDQMLATTQTALASLVDAVRSTWHEIRVGWSMSDNASVFHTFLSPMIVDTNGSLEGFIRVGVHMEDPEDFFISYAINRKIKGGFESVEAKGFRFSPDGQYVTDYLNSPRNIALPIFKDKEGIKTLKFVEMLVKNAMEVAHIPSE